MRIICVIPARYRSSRFEGKPLAQLSGKPMIWWVYQKVKNVKHLDGIYVATDDKRIQEACDEWGIPVLMTSCGHPTGVDRLAEAASKIPGDYYLLVQGDEPLIETEAIQNMADRIASGEEDAVLTFRTKIKNPVDAVNSTVIKIVTALDHQILLASRSPIPYPKAGIEFDYYKSVGIYAYPRSVLLRYPSLPVGPLEQAEDHDFMRMLENGIKIKAYEIDTNTISVDTPKDLRRVQEFMKGLTQHADIEK